MIPPDIETAVELEGIYDEFETAWANSGPASVEDELEKVSDNLKARAFEELLGIEIDQRLAQSQVPSVSDYLQRFPAYAGIITNAFDSFTQFDRQTPILPRFKPIEILGVGGQGQVWLMKDRLLGRHVAVKINHAAKQSRRSKKSSLQLEAEIGGRLEHPNIIPIYDVASDDETIQDGETSQFHIMRVFGDSRLHTAFEAFHARPRRMEDCGVVSALRHFDKRPTGENRLELESWLSRLSLRSDNEVDLALKNTIESILLRDSDAGSLDRAISRLFSQGWTRSAQRRLLGNFQRVCEGVSYAHSKQVVHGDIKPQNVMLGEFGETLVVDWGMATILTKDGNQFGRVPLDPSSSSVTGIRGTPSYMSPEQASGSGEITPRSDVYSLGAILYCILTGRPPFDPPKDERETVRVLKNVCAGQFPDPHKVCPKVPKPVEAIVLKAMSLNPDSRYESPQALANDVQLWMDGHAIDVYPDTWLQKGVRRLRDHPTVAASALVTVLLGLVFAGAMWSRTNLHAKELASLLTKEKAARELADQNRRWAERQEAIAKRNEAVAKKQSEISLQTIDRVIFEFTNALAELPASSTARKAILDAVFPQLDELSQQFLEQSSIDDSTAAAMIGIGDSLLEIGQAPIDDLKTPHAHPSAVRIAFDYFQRAHRIYSQLYIESKHVRHHRQLQACEYRLATTLDRLGDNDEAIERYRNAVNVSKLITSSQDSSSDDEHVAASAYLGLANALMGTQELDEANRHAETALRIFRALRDADPDNPDFRRSVAMAFNQQAVLAKLVQDYEVCYERFAEAIHTLVGPMKNGISPIIFPSRQVKELRESGSSRSWRDNLLLAGIHRAVGDTKLILRRREGAAEHFQAALAFCEDVDASQNMYARGLKSSIQLSLGMTYSQLGVRNESVAQFESAIRSLRDEFEADTDNWRRRTDLANALLQTAICDVELLQIALATETLESCIEILRTPQSTEYSQILLRQAEGHRELCIALIAEDSDEWEHFRENYPELLEKFMLTWSRLVASRGNFELAMSATDVLQDLETYDRRAAYGAARVFAICAAKAEPDIPDVSAELKFSRAEFVKRSVAALNDAIEFGFDDWELLRHEPEFIQLRRQPEFDVIEKIISDTTRSNLSSFLDELIRDTEEAIQPNSEK
ncbi:MAG: hypothetical protein Aurels2KO_48090 [Aureliella sp.]